jgi:hypothetical protein
VNRRSFFARLLGIAAIPVAGKVAAMLPAAEWTEELYDASNVSVTSIARGLWPTIGSYREYVDLRTLVRAHLDRWLNDEFDRVFYEALTTNKPLAFPARTPITRKF